ncbi:serine protease [Anopheles darlingi]|uniref:Serine protease n=1 Tax=Anopheles darlingi TaxID=43151 RepID=W5JFD0_ANODA|nr:serine protease [Anopheles darlingi]
MSPNRNKRVTAESMLLGSILLPVVSCLLWLTGSASGQYLTSPCPEIFSYRLEPSTNQAFGYIELNNLRIGTTVKLMVDLSYNVEVSKQNLGSITLVKSNEETFRDIYNNLPAQYRVNFPFRNIYPKVLAIRVNGETVCSGSPAQGRIVTTVNLDHTLYTEVQQLPFGAQGNGIQFLPGMGNGFQSPAQQQPVTQRPNVFRPQGQPVTRPSVYQPPVQTVPQYPERPRPQTVPQPQPQPQAQPQPESQPQPQPQSPSATNSEILCGTVAPLGNRLSINGKRSSRGQFPWAAPIFNTAGVPKPQYICGSSIISTTHLITAAHCMFFPDGTERQPDQLTVVPGMFNIDNFFDNDNQDREVSKIHTHEEYVHEDLLVTDSDIAVLVLSQAIIYNDVVRPVCLWSGSDNQDQVVGSKGYVSGWGITESGDAKYPSYVTATIKDRRECSRQLGRLFSANSRTFCGDGEGAVPCNGDSGSGLVIKRGRQNFLRGVVSVGQYDQVTLLCDTEKYVVYTDVAPFRYWLLRITKS